MYSFSFSIMDQTPFYSFINKPDIIEYNATYYAQVYNLYLITYREIAFNVPSVQSYIRKSLKNTFSVDSHGITVMCHVISRIAESGKE